jgi:hypothetical protein
MSYTSRTFLQATLKCWIFDLKPQTISLEHHSLIEKSDRKFVVFCFIMLLIDSHFNRLQAPEARPIVVLPLVELRSGP